MIKSINTILISLFVFIIGRIGPGNQHMRWVSRTGAVADGRFRVPPPGHRNGFGGSPKFLPLPITSRLNFAPDNRRGGEIGRRAGLKIRYPQGCGGSSPPLGTNVMGRDPAECGEKPVPRAKRFGKSRTPPSAGLLGTGSAYRHDTRHTLYTDEKRPLLKGLLCSLYIVRIGLF